MPFAELSDVTLHYRLDGDESLPVLMLSTCWAPASRCGSRRLPR